MHNIDDAAYLRARVAELEHQIELNTAAVLEARSVLDELYELREKFAFSLDTTK